MDINTVPTKSNLIAAKNTHSLAKQGYELMDKKRSILVKELMELSDKGRFIQRDMSAAFSEAYQALQRVIVAMGRESVNEISRAVPVEEGISIKSRSIMGINLPLVLYSCDDKSLPPYGLAGSIEDLDIAYKQFSKAKAIAIEYALIENTAYKLKISIKKTGIRANALQNLTIPKYEAIIKYIQNALEERERDEFIRLKVVKRLKEPDQAGV